MTSLWVYDLRELSYFGLYEWGCLSIVLNHAKSKNLYNTLGKFYVMFLYVVNLYWNPLKCIYLVHQIFLCYLWPLWDYLKKQIDQVVDKLFQLRWVSSMVEGYQKIYFQYQLRNPFFDLRLYQIWCNMLRHHHFYCGLL